MALGRPGPRATAPDPLRGENGTPRSCRAPGACYSPPVNPAEEYLCRFHQNLPRATSEGLGLGRSRAGQSSYGMLLEELGDEAGSILELGCGEGHLLAALDNAVGIDIARSDLDIAQSVGPCALARAQALPFADDSFDVVLSHLVMTVVPLEDTLAEAARVLRPGGRFLAIVQSDMPPQGSFMKFIERLYEGLEGVQVPELGDGRLSDRNEADALLAAAGFEAVRYRDRSLHFEPEERRALFGSLYGIDLLSEAAREHALDASKFPGDCSADVRLISARLG